MMSLTTRPSVFDEMVSLRDAVENLFENSFLNPSTTTGVFGKQPLAALNVYEDNKNFYVLGLFPGIDQDKLELNVKENVLTISGEYEYSGWPKEISGTSEKGEGGKENTPPMRVLLNEVPQGQFYRQVRLPVAFDADKIEAHFDNGLLKLIIPKAESSQVKRINVRSAHGQIEGQVAGSPQLAGRSS